MKRYYNIDFAAMKIAGLNPTQWMIMEDIQFRSSASESGWCDTKRQDMADDHMISIQQLKKIILKLDQDGWIKRDKMHRIKVTQKWIKINEIGDENQRQKEGRVDERGRKNARAQKVDDVGRIDAPLQPYKKELSKRLKKTNKKKTDGFEKNLPEKLQEWIEYRRQIKRPIKQPTISKLLSKFEADPEEISRQIDRSITNGWQGLFPEKKSPRNFNEPEPGSLGWMMRQQDHGTIDTEAIEAEVCHA
jgi:DNA-binding MarR family transcriptional regulator